MLCCRNSVSFIYTHVGKYLKFQKSNTLKLQKNVDVSGKLIMLKKASEKYWNHIANIFDIFRKYGFCVFFASK